MAFSENISTYKIAKEKISIAKASQDKFNDYISISGLVRPISIVYLDTYESGRVSDVYIEEGSMVQKGDVILKLENTDVYSSVSLSKDRLISKQNSLRDLRVKFDSERLLGQKNILEAAYSVSRAKRKQEQTSYAFKEGFGPKNDYLQAMEDLELAIKREEFTETKTY